MHRVFISYHHSGDFEYKQQLLNLSDQYSIFHDGSVDTHDIDNDLPDTRIRELIRDDYLRDTTVTIVLVGLQTSGRKHVDWEIYSSMFDGTKNKKSGILVITLPTTGCGHYTAPHDGEKKHVYPDQSSWMSIDNRAGYEERYPHMPARIIDNLLEPRALVSVTNWGRIINDPGKLSFLIDAANKDRAKCEYNLSRTMRRANS